MITKIRKTFIVNKSYIGEPLTQKIQRIINGGGGIEKQPDLTYSEQYDPGMDIRTDRWEVALEGLIKGDKIKANEEARRKDAALQEKERAEAEATEKFNKQVAEEVAKRATELAGKQPV